MDTDFTAAKIETLIQTTDPTATLFRWILELWDAEGVDDDLLNDYYDEREKATRRLTWTLNQIYEEFWEKELLPQVNSRQVSELLQEPRYALVLMDSLSLREACLLRQRLPHHGYDIQALDYAFSELPSDTATFCRRHWNTSAPSQIRDPHFVYVSADTPPLDDLTQEQLTVWGTYPDWFWYHAHSGRTEHIPPAEIYHKTETLLLALLNRIREHERIIISSDHGYLGVKAGMAWPTPEPLRTYLKEVLGSRFETLSDSKKARALLRAGLIIAHDNHYLIRGRYTGDFGSVYLHGGLSLLECLTPWLVIRRK